MQNSCNSLILPNFLKENKAADGQLTHLLFSVSTTEQLRLAEGRSGKKVTYENLSFD